MALTTLAAVKAFKGISATDQDAEITRLITVVSEYLTRYCRRTFDQNATLVEYHSGTSGQTTLRLDRPPINSIASIYDDPERAYGASTLVAATDYVIEDAAAGLVRLDWVSFQAGLNNVKVTYSGGYATIPPGGGGGGGGLGGLSGGPKQCEGDLWRRLRDDPGGAGAGGDRAGVAGAGQGAVPTAG